MNDMQKIVSELIDTGITQQELADMANCAQSTIGSYLRGTRGGIRPSYDIAKKLLDLHKKKCRNVSNKALRSMSK